MYRRHLPPHQCATGPATSVTKTMCVLTLSGVFAFDDADFFKFVTGDFFDRHHDGLNFFRVRRQYTEFDVMPFGFKLPSNYEYAKRDCDYIFFSS